MASNVVGRKENARLRETVCRVYTPRVLGVLPSPTMHDDDDDDDDSLSVPAKENQTRCVMLLRAITAFDKHALSGRQRRPTTTTTTTTKKK